MGASDWDRVYEDKGIEDPHWRKRKFQIESCQKSVTPTLNQLTPKSYKWDVLNKLAAQLNAGYKAGLLLARGNLDKT